MVNAGKVTSNCICFGENIVTIKFQAPVFVNKKSKTFSTADLIAC